MIIIPWAVGGRGAAAVEWAGISSLATDQPSDAAALLK